MLSSYLMLIYNYFFLLFSQLFFFYALLNQVFNYDCINLKSYLLKSFLKYVENFIS